MEGDPLTTVDAVVEHVVELVEGAAATFSLTVLPGTLPSVRAPLERAIDNDVLVLLLASGHEPVDAAELKGLATVTRRWTGRAPLTCTVDGERGLFAPGSFFAGQRADRPAATTEDSALVHAMFSEFVGNYWLSGAEMATADPTPLPATYENFRHAVVEATLRLRNRQVVEARVEGRPVGDTGTETVTGTLVNARQSFVYPVTSSFPSETSLGLRTEDGLVTVGGWGAFVEDYEAESVTLTES